MKNAAFKLKLSSQKNYIDNIVFSFYRLILDEPIIDGLHFQLLRS